MLCAHETFHFHPKTFDTSKHHCQCLPRHEVSAADAKSHPSFSRELPSLLSFVCCMLILLLVVMLAVGKVYDFTKLKRLKRSQYSNRMAFKLLFEIG